MKISIFFLIIFLGFTQSLVGQDFVRIEGKILEIETNKTLAFANIYNKSSKKGTISNSDGYFEISINAVTDTIIVSYLGYNVQIINLESNKKNYLIYLAENNFQLGEVSIFPKDYSYLFDLISACKKSISKIEMKSKAFYQLKSFVGENQIELVEGYYNIDVIGNKLMTIQLKAGRIALHLNRNHFFTSLESSQALLMLNLFEGNDYFPKNPFELNKSKLKKNYFLDLENKFIDNSNDSIYIAKSSEVDHLNPV